MPEYLSPGVYVEEISTGPRPIEGVSTSTAGFVGLTERGPVAPRLVTSWADYLRWYGGYIDTAMSYLPFSVKGFFDNGGQRAFIARVYRTDATRATIDIPAGGQNLQLEANGPGAWGNRVFVRIEDPSRQSPDPNHPRFKLTLLYYVVAPPVPFVDPFVPANIADPNRRIPDAIEVYDNLGVDPAGPSYVATTIDGASQLVHVTNVPQGVPAPVAFAPLAGGGDGAAALDATAFSRNLQLPNDQREGLAGLEVIDQVSLLCVPDHVHPALAVAERTQLMNEIVNQCERLKDRFAVLQVDADLGDMGQIIGRYPERDSSYGAVYFPWVRVLDPRNGDTPLIPPGGFVTGLIARTDIERGVHKAPANEEVRGIITRDLNGTRKPLQYLITKGQQDLLNPRGINAIRDFRADRRGIRLWGARTMSSDGQWKYVNVRRLFLFVEESIDEGTQWVVFEPNDEPTWSAVRRSITNFLIRVWRSGALMGATEEEAFFVKCDRTTMTQDDIDNGRLICLIGIAPVKPAEFVIFRISQKTADAAA